MKPPPKYSANLDVRPADVTTLAIQLFQLAQKDGERLQRDDRPLATELCVAARLLARAAVLLPEVQRLVAREREAGAGPAKQIRLEDAARQVGVTERTIRSYCAVREIHPDRLFQSDVSGLKTLKAQLAKRVVTMRGLAECKQKRREMAERVAARRRGTERETAQTQAADRKSLKMVQSK